MYPGVSEQTAYPGFDLRLRTAFVHVTEVIRVVWPTDDTAVHPQKARNTYRQRIVRILLITSKSKFRVAIAACSGLQLTSWGLRLQAVIHVVATPQGKRVGHTRLPQMHNLMSARVAA
jgi:hypothetical protein